MNKSAQNIKLRLLSILIVFLCGYAVLLARDFHLLVGTDDRLARLEGRQRVYKEKISEQRGTIYDRNGRILAVSIKVPSVFIDPSLYKPGPTDQAKLAKLIDMSSKDVDKAIKKGAKRFVWLKRFLDPTKESQIVDLKVKGVYITKEWKRFYPEKDLAGQVIGAVGSDGHGLEGLEKFYDQFLRSEEKTVKAERDARGRAILLDDDSTKDVSRGAALYLTLDTALQYHLEKEIKDAASKSGTNTAFGVVMDPHSGAILAMASYPPVNPNTPEKFPLNAWRNRVVQEIFEPGSTFKIFTLATALEKGIISPDKSILCSSGSLVIGNKNIKNDSDKGDWLTPRSILKYSNNIGTARIGLEIGAYSFAQTMTQFGFGKKTGVEFPGEPMGLFSNPSSWKALELANISFGQGIGVTALQLTTGVSLIANGGYALRPKLVSQMVLPHQTWLPEENEENETYQRVLSANTVNQITDFMEAVIEPEGTGKRAKIPGYRVAGKTGTAQMIDPVTKKYSHSVFTSSFVGFLPASNPKLVSMIVFRAPQNSMHGGEIAAPVFQKVMSHAIRYLEVPPDEQQNVGQVKKPQMAQMGVFSLPKPSKKKEGQKI